VAAIVALRVGIGLHFYLEGTTKLRDKKPFSGPFFAAAKGPLAPLYKSLVWDPDGRTRLDPRGVATADHWKRYSQQVASHFHFDKAQTDAANKAMEGHLKRMGSFLGSNRDEIELYFDQLNRRDKNLVDPQRPHLTAFKAHDARIAADRAPAQGTLLADVDKIWKAVENDMNALATPEQMTRHGWLPIGKVGHRFGDTETMDAVVPYFDTIIGLLLIIGLFTRVASVAGALFLASVCASQWPGYGGAPIYYQFVEMLALLALAAIGAGQFYGIDYVLSGLRKLRQQSNPPASPVRTQNTNQPASVLVPVKGAKA
jgi:uncharacterized membrane protein YphA (DoxX/SURF4 family)